MAHAELCPVCNGAGKLLSKQDPGSTSAQFPSVCHGCNGKGWVEVSDVIPTPPPVHYPWWYWPGTPFYYYTYTTSAPYEEKKDKG